MSGGMFGRPNMLGAGHGVASVIVKPVGVFWDIENCQPPSGKLASSVIHHIRNFFVINRLNNREYEFLVACDVTKIRKDIPEDINRAGGVTLAHVSGTSKNAADEKLRESMKRFVDTHGQLAPLLVLISGDIDFVNDLRAYQTRLGCSVIIIHGISSSAHFKQGWNELYSFQEFCLAVPAASATVGNNGKPTTGPQGDGEKSRSNSNKGPPNKQGPPLIKGSKGKGAGGGPSEVVIPPPNLSRGQPNAPNKLQQARPKQTPDNQNFPTGNVNPGKKANKEKKVDGQQVQNLQPQKNPGGLNQLTKGLAQLQASEKEEIILMVTGLPGKMDYRILKEHLQEAASSVNGKVKYVKNGQGFITFRKKQDADRAVQLFFGKEVYGKQLNITQVKSIPFENPRPAPPQQQQQQQQQGKGNQSDFVMVNSQQPLGGLGRSTGIGTVDDSFAGALGVFAGAAFKELAKGNDGPSTKPKKEKKQNQDPNCSIQ